ATLNKIKFETTARQPRVWTVIDFQGLVEVDTAATPSHVLARCLVRRRLAWCKKHLVPVLVRACQKPHVLRVFDEIGLPKNLDATNVFLSHGVGVGSGRLENEQKRESGLS